MKETTRVQLELPVAALERLKVLKDKTEASSYAEVTKNAFKLYERIVELQESGHTFVVRDRKGGTRDLEFFL